MKTVFISDLHLSEKLPCVTENLRTLLANLNQVEALYILGDLFEVWIGDDEATPFQLEIAALLKKASEDCPIFFMPGNRDFLLGKNYCKQSGMTYLLDPSVINLYDQKILLMHGDGLCTQDKIHQFYRTIVRSKLFKFLFLSLPLSYRQKIATKIRQRSQQRNQYISAELMDIDLGALKKSLDNHQCSQAIYGHTHRPSIIYYDFSNSLKKIFVLSDWHTKGNTLEFDSNCLNTLKYF